VSLYAAGLNRARYGSQTLHAEWTKLRTLASTGWLLLAAAALTVSLSAVADAAASCPAGGCQADPAKLSLTGVQAGQAVVAVIAVLAVSGEYSTGMIRVTLTAVPRRLTVLAAKAALVTGLVLAVSAVAAAACLLAGRLILPGHGFTAAHGFPPLSPGDGPVLRAVCGSVLYLALIALLSLGVATAVREAAVAIGLVLGLLYLFPVVASVAANPHWQRHLEQIGPMTAGLDIQATTALGALPLTPWQGLGVLAAWAAAALLAGALVLRCRDALVSRAEFSGTFFAAAERMMSITGDAVRVGGERPAGGRPHETTGAAMKYYLLAMHQPVGDPPPPEILEPIMRDLGAVRLEMQAAGVWVFDGGLHGPEASTVLQVRDGEVLVTDGPYAEGKEHLGGFVIIKVPTWTPRSAGPAGGPRPCGCCRSRSARSTATPSPERPRGGADRARDLPRVPGRVRAGGRRPGLPLRRHRRLRGGGPGRLRRRRP
jgi:ABC-2 type transport system permease protein